jgi:hypothetical protein
MLVILSDPDPELGEGEGESKDLHLLLFFNLPHPFRRSDFLNTRPMP